jgi:hypothetical protein
MSEQYNPHNLGTDHLPDSSTPERAETARDVERARKANRLHDAANKLAERGNRK